MHELLRAPRRLGRPYYPIVAGLLVVIVIAAAAVARRASGEENLYVLQADAFLHGRLDIAPSYADAAIYRGRFYVPFPPFPALVLLPLVAAFGPTATRVQLVSLAISGLSLAALVRILRRLAIPPSSVPWLVAAFFLGTAYWLAMAFSYSVWLFAHVVATACLFLAIDEALGRGRGFLVGLLLGLAFLSRQMTVYAGLFLLAALWERPVREGRTRQLVNLLGFVLAFAGCAGLYLAFNRARFGSPFDTGYAYIPLDGFLQERVARYGLFNIAYVPFNLVNLFLQGLHLEFQKPLYLAGARADLFGTSLTFASPFVFVALRARWRKLPAWGAWLAVGLTIAHTLLYYNNGWKQMNAQRFTLDFLPVLMPLVALGTQRVPGKLWKAAVLYSILLNLFALGVVPLLWG